MTRKKEYASTLNTYNIVIPGKNGSIILSSDDNGKLLITSENFDGEKEVFVVDPTNDEIVASKIKFKDGTSLNTATASNVTVDLNNDPIIADINTTLIDIGSRFDTDGLLRPEKIPTIGSAKLDPSIITDISIGKSGKDIAVAAAADVSSINGRFDENNKLRDTNLPDNAITDINFSDKFDVSFAGKDIVTNADFPSKFDTRFAGKNPITTTNFGSNFDSAFSGKNPITTANFGDTFDAAFTGKNPVTTGVGGNFDDLFDGKVPTGYNTWADLATSATNGNDAFSKFSGAGGKLPVDSVIPPGDYTGWAEINTDIAKGISADIKADTIEGRFTDGKLNEANAADSLKNSNVTKTSIGLGNVANESPATIRSGIIVDNDGKLQGIGTGAGTAISNSKITVNSTTGIIEGIGTSGVAVRNDLITKGSIGLGDVENKSSTDIRNEIQIANGVLSGIGTSGIVVNNASIGLSRDPTSGEITLDKGVGTPVTVNPFNSTEFTNTKNNATTAKNTADTIEGRFTAGKLNEANAADGLKNSSVIINNGVLSGIGTNNVYVENRPLIFDSTSPSYSSPRLGDIVNIAGTDGMNGNVFAYSEKVYDVGENLAGSSLFNFSTVYSTTTEWVSSLEAIFQRLNRTDSTGVLVAYLEGKVATEATAKRVFYIHSGKYVTTRDYFYGNVTITIRYHPVLRTTVESTTAYSNFNYTAPFDGSFGSYSYMSLAMRDDSNVDTSITSLYDTYNNSSLGSQAHDYEGTWRNSSQGKYKEITATVNLTSPKRLKIFVQQGTDRKIVISSITVNGWIPNKSNDVEVKLREIEANITNFSFTFTGQHKCRIENDLELQEGLIVSSIGTYDNVNHEFGEKQHKITSLEAVPVVKISDIPNDKKVVGVVCKKADISDNNSAVFTSDGKKDNQEKITRYEINSLGEGGIWVCNINGDLENGDYITTCEIPGYGMKQDDDLLHNYTVAKITCDCNFDLQSPIYICEEFQHSGSVYRRAFVGCTYHCG